MLILDEDCVIRQVKRKSQVIKPIYAMVVEVSKIFDDENEYRYTEISDNFYFESEQIYFITSKGKITKSVTKARQFKNIFGYMGWCYLHAPMDMPAQHKLVNIAPYLESLKDPRNKWFELKKWLEGQNWRNPLDEYDMEIYVEKDKLMAKIRELDDTLIVPYNAINND